MKKLFLLLLLFVVTFGSSFGQSKTVIGIVAFKSPGTQQNYNNRNSNGGDKYTTEIQDAVTTAFLNAKRFTLVDREKMDQLKSEKNLQKNDDFIDGTVVEQSKSLGCQYIVAGNVTEAGVEQKESSIPYGGRITSYKAQITFSVKVVDVSTGQIMASNVFQATAKGKNSFEDALTTIKPDVEKFIKDNFKVTISIAQVEDKDASGNATKILIAGGSSVGMKPNTVLKVFEITQLTVDGKVMDRKVQVGKITVASVEDENFSDCTVNEGGSDIAKKMLAGSKLKCEIISE